VQSMRQGRDANYTRATLDILLYGLSKLRAERRRGGEMSYNIAVMSFKLPETFFEANVLVEPLLGKDVAKIKTEYLAFYEAVTELFPCICDLPSNSIDSGIWSDGPLINNFTVEVPVIGISYEKVENALPVVRELALSMGLSVLDWQLNQAYNPG